MSARQLAGPLLGEQVVVYLFGMIGGTVLGVVARHGDAPFLLISDTTGIQALAGHPAVSGGIQSVQTILLFYPALLVAFVLALLIAARYAATIGIGKGCASARINGTRWGDSWPKAGNP